MPANKNYRIAGFAARTHGLKGELKLRLSSPFSFEDMLEKGFLLLDIRGKRIPFYVESFSEHRDEVIARLKNVSTIEEAEKLTGSRLMADEKLWVEDEKAQGQNLKGFLLVDKKLGKLGVIEEVLEMPAQNLLKFKHNGQNSLVPLVDDFIREIKPRKKEIHVDLPDGLLDLNK